MHVFNSCGLGEFSNYGSSFFPVLLTVSFCVCLFFIRIVAEKITVSRITLKRRVRKGASSV